MESFQGATAHDLVPENAPQLPVPGAVAPSTPGSVGLSRGVGVAADFAVDETPFSKFAREMEEDGMGPARSGFGGSSHQMGASTIAADDPIECTSTLLYTPASTSSQFGDRIMTSTEVIAEWRQLKATALAPTLRVEDGGATVKVEADEDSGRISTLWEVPPESDDDSDVEGVHEPETPAQSAARLRAEEHHLPRPLQDAKAALEAIPVTQRGTSKELLAYADLWRLYSPAAANSLLMESYQARSAQVCCLLLSASVVSAARALLAAPLIAIPCMHNT